jgi:hypothetical protein
MEIMHGMNQESASGSSEKSVTGYQTAHRNFSKYSLWGLFYGLYVQGL